MSNPSTNLSIMRATQVTEELYLACQSLIPQLTSHNPPPTRGDLALLIASETACLFIARHLDYNNKIIGIATLAFYRVPTGLRAYIEDVVVDEMARGQHIGKALTQACLDQAQQAGVAQVMLTSNPARVAANRLYQRMGFELRKTNVYKYSFIK